MGAEDGVRILALLSGVVLFYSTLLQLKWQRTQAQRDEEVPHEEPTSPTAAGTPVPADEEAANLNKFAATRRENALRPYFDVQAFRYFLLGFLVSVISSALDL